MPENYMSNEKFISSVEFLENREWELALDCLIELADESEHYFSEDFWLGLSDSADNMGLTGKAKYCREQIKRNEKNVKSKTPFGWTTIKIDDTCFQHHISEKLKEEWIAQRRTKDKVYKLLAKPGVHLKSDGRSGFLYISVNGKIAEVEYEFEINCLVLYFKSLTTWSMPVRQELSVEEKHRIRIDINNWAIKTGNVIEFDD